MKVLTITQVLRSPAAFREALQKGNVLIEWKEAKPNGKVIFQAIAKKAAQGKGKDNAKIER